MCTCRHNACAQHMHNAWAQDMCAHDCGQQGDNWGEITPIVYCPCWPTIVYAHPHTWHVCAQRAQHVHVMHGAYFHSRTMFGYCSQLSHVMCNCAHDMCHVCCAPVHLCTHTCIHMHTHTCVHICVQVCTHSWFHSLFSDFPFLLSIVFIFIVPSIGLYSIYCSLFLEVKLDYILGFRLLACFPAGLETIILVRIKGASGRTTVVTWGNEWLTEGRHAVRLAILTMNVMNSNILG